MHTRSSAWGLEQRKSPINLLAVIVRSFHLESILLEQCPNIGPLDITNGENLLGIVPKKMENMIILFSKICSKLWCFKLIVAPHCLVRSIQLLSEVSISLWSLRIIQDSWLSPPVQGTEQLTSVCLTFCSMDRESMFAHPRNMLCLAVAKEGIFSFLLEV